MHDQPLWPTPAVETLLRKYKGKRLQDVDGPQAVLDVAVIRKSCHLMLNAVDVLDIQTVEITKLQVGDAPRDVNLIASTVAEIEFLLDYLLECKANGRKVHVIYGIPPSSTCLDRLAQIQQLLGPSSLAFMIDHTSQLRHLKQFSSRFEPAHPFPVFLKVDVGYHRAGIPPHSSVFHDLLSAVVEHPHCELQGFYSHDSNSYSASSPAEALGFLENELERVSAAAAAAASKSQTAKRFILSVGAIPSVSSAQNLLAKDSADPTVKRVKALITRIQESHDVELHAGVYPVLDLQQLATHARPQVSTDTSTMTTDDIGIRIMAEVLSVYPAGSRTEKSEALIGAGTLALGREPCKAYPGWGVVAPAPWNKQMPQQIYSEDNRTGWIVDRISQEHGVLTWEGPEQHLDQLHVGDKLMVWPNHACITAAGYGWFLVVDSGIEEGTKVIDVWIKCRGW